MRSGALPTAPIYVDSPMALAALEVYRHAVRTRPQESAALDRGIGPAVVISASGMATGGRARPASSGDEDGAVRVVDEFLPD